MGMMLNKMIEIFKLSKKEVENEIKSAKDLKDLDQIFNKYLGKKGEITLLLRSLKDIPKEKRAKVGKEANLLKAFIEREIKEKSEKMRLAGTPSEETDRIDITIPGRRPTIGHLHPLTQTKRKFEEIFQSMGFSVIEGPEIENEFYNFEALNIPAHHPARSTFCLSLCRTFYLKGGNLLRSHTSSVQIRYMEKHHPPLRIIVPGRVFRNEATDAKHEFNLYQIEGLMVDKSVSIANFKAILQEFLNRFFQKQIKMRLRPSYFPFTEPSFEVDIECVVCGGKGCPTCLGGGWMEMMGAGMVHPNVFKNVGLSPKDWQGFAFGMGMDRFAMMKYGINDIRFFYSGDLRFLQQF
jgi:phenylalanyl-tRNA synthetase alpha chain